MKNILITGAAGNLGRAAVEKFLSEGAHVIATLGPNDKAENLPQGDELEAYPVNLLKEDEAAEFVQKMDAERGGLDAIIMIVGGFSMGDIEATTGEDLMKMYRLNVETAYFTARPAFLEMQKRGKGGRLIFIGARPALDPNAAKDMIAYSFSKSLLFRLAEVLNVAGKESKIVSSVIVPSIIDTPMNRKYMADANFDDWVKPSEIADLMHELVTNRVLREPVLKVYGNA